MLSEASRTTAEQARILYATVLQQQLERDSLGDYVSIEPVSGRYFVAETFDAAVNAALDAFPDRLTHTMRIGHEAALHLGVLVQ
jgi:hypothetical protein